MNTQTRRRLSDLPRGQQAGIMCNDPSFQKFAAVRSGMPDREFNASAAAEYLRMSCGVNSRAHLDTNLEAAKRFATLKTEFDAWAGKIAAQR